MTNDQQKDQAQLRRALGLFDATAISIGAIIGAGIFIVIGIVAGLAGPSVIISIILAGVVASFSALSFAQLSAHMPREGGGYEFSYHLLSPYAGFLAGWMWIFSNIFTGAAVSLGFAQYLVSVFPFLPIQIMALALCLTLTLINYFGIRESAALNNILVLSKIVILFLFIVLGVSFLKVGNFMPFAPQGVSGVLKGTALIFFAYGGYARVTTVAEEVKDASRTIPRAILLALVLSTLIYVSISFAAVGLVGSERLSQSGSPLADAISITGSSEAVWLVSAGAMIATASVLLMSILGVSRMTFAMARNKQLPKSLNKIHPRFQTPHYAVWATGISSAILVFVGFYRVVAVGTFALLFHHALVNLSAIRLRAESRRYPLFVSVIGLLLCLTLLVFLSSDAWVIGIAGLVAASLYYGVVVQKSKP